MNNESPFFLDFDAVCELFYGKAAVTPVEDDDDYAPDPMDLAKAIREDEGI
jgi:hypothetical protein